MFTAVAQSGETIWPWFEQHLVSLVLPKIYYSWTMFFSFKSTWLESSAFHASISPELAKKKLSIKTMPMCLHTE